MDVHASTCSYGFDFLLDMAMAPPYSRIRTIVRTAASEAMGPQHETEAKSFGYKGTNHHPT